MNNINQQINKLKLILILSLMNKKNREETNDITQLLFLCIEAITQIDTEEGETQTTQIEGVEAIATNYDSNSNHNSNKSSDEENNRNLCQSVLICENLCYDNAIDGGSRPVSVTIGATFDINLSYGKRKVSFYEKTSNQTTSFSFKSQDQIIMENLLNHGGSFQSDTGGYYIQKEIIEANNTAGRNWTHSVNNKFGETLSYNIQEDIFLREKNPKGIHTLLIIGDADYTSNEYEKEFYQNMSMLDNRNGFDVIYYNNAIDLRKSIQKYTDVSTIMFIGGHSSRLDSSNYVLLSKKNFFGPDNFRGLKLPNLQNLYLLGCYMGSINSINRWKSAVGINNYGSKATLYAVNDYVNPEGYGDQLSIFSTRILVHKSSEYPSDFRELFNNWIIK